MTVATTDHGDGERREVSRFGAEWYEAEICVGHAWTTNIAGIASAAILATILGKIIYRLCLLPDEIRNRRTRHDGCWRLAVSRTIDFNRRVLVFSVVSTFVLAACVRCDWTNSESVHYSVMIPVIAFVRLLLHYYGFEKLSKLNRRWNVGRLFALQYYYGYLNLVLPSLLERMKEYELDELKGETEFAVRRLVLLAPESCRSPPTLDWFTIDRRRVDLYKTKQMKPVKTDRCGTGGRVYKNPIYVIWSLEEDGEMKWFCFAIEGIAMLHNLYEMNVEVESTGLTDARRRKEYANFCDALCELLHTSPYDGLVELIQYKDENDSDGLDVGIADTVMQRFRNLKRTTKI